MARENDLGRDPIRPLVWRIALPSMLAQCVSVLYSIVDRMYIGHIADVGDLALAGVGVIIVSASGKGEGGEAHTPEQKKRIEEYQAAVDDKPAVSPAQAPPDREHGVGIVLLHREHFRSLRNETQRVKVAQYDIRPDPQALGMLQAAVSSDDKIFISDSFRQRIKSGGAKNHTSAHKVTSFCHSTTFPPNGKPPEN